MHKTIRHRFFTGSKHWFISRWHPARGPEHSRVVSWITRLERKEWPVGTCGKVQDRRLYIADSRQHVRQLCKLLEKTWGGLQVHNPADLGNDHFSQRWCLENSYVTQTEETCFGFVVLDRDMWIIYYNLRFHYLPQHLFSGADWIVCMDKVFFLGRDLILFIICIYIYTL